MEYDVIIIGSGPAGVHAALPLVEAGLRVVMLDGGNSAPPILEEPIEDFLTVRKNRKDQWRWFIGEDYSNIPLAGLDGGYGGGMASGNKAYVTAMTDKELPLLTDQNTSIVQSFATGGLAAAWGGACASYSPEILKEIGLPVTEIVKTTKEIEQLIGISGNRKELQPPFDLNDYMKQVLKRYQKKQSWFQKNQLEITQPDTALLTLKMDDRKAESYKDMGYFSDEGRSIYRPQWTLEYLNTNANFYYITQKNVQKIYEKKNLQIAEVYDCNNNETKMYTAKKIILAAGAIGTARIILKSFPEIHTLPLNAKAHGYIVCLDIRQLGVLDESKRTSLCQLLLTDCKNIKGVPVGAAQLYSYRSLQLFRLLSSTPLARPIALKILAHIVPAITLADIRFTNQNSHSTIERTKTNILKISSQIPSTVKLQRNNSIKRMKNGLRKLGLIPVRTMLQAEGSCSHYAGTCPMNNGKTPIYTNKDGTLNVNKNVYIADSSVFAMLPALPPTLTIMAYARYIGQSIAKNMTKSHK